MDLDALECMLFDDARIVTAVTLARNSNIDIETAISMLNSFYEKFKGKNGLWGVMSVSGSIERNGIVCDAMVLSKDGDLEQTKRGFNDVKSVELFSLQTVEIEDFYSIMASDALDDDQFFRGDFQRAAIKTSKVEELRKAMESGGVTKPAAAKRPAAAVTEVKPSVASAKATPKLGEKKPDIQKMFQKACTKEKTPRNSPVKAVRDSPFSSKKKRPELAPSSSSSPLEKPRRRARKILIDDDEDDSQSPPPKKSLKEDIKRETSASPERVSKDAKGSCCSKKNVQSKKLLDDGDLFDANGSSPNVSPEKVVPAKKSKSSSSTATKEKKQKAQKKIKEEEESVENTSPPTVAVRRSPRKHKAADPDVPEGKRKVIRKVAETFMDEDGFLVNKEVFKEFIVDASEVEESKPLADTQKTNQPTSTMAVGKKQQPKNQSKISSFFTKK